MKLKRDKPLSHLAFNCKLRPCTLAKLRAETGGDDNIELHVCDISSMAGRCRLTPGLNS